MRPGGQPNMAQLMKQAQKMQEQIAQAQAELAEIEVEGSAAGGLVTAVVTGGNDLVSVTIDPSVVDADEAHRGAWLVQRNASLRLSNDVLPSTHSHHMRAQLPRAPFHR